MTILREIAERINELPALRQRRTLAGKLQRYSESARASQARLEGAVRIRKSIGAVFPELDFARFDDQVRKAAVAARLLHASLSKSPDAVDDRQTDKAITRLNEIAVAANSEVKKSWTSLVSGKATTFARIAEVANRAGLAGAADFEIRVNRLCALQASPPETRKKADDVRDLISALGTAVGQIGLEGSVGEFLAAAVGGDGDVAALDDQAVRTFLGKAKLWSRLRVKLV